MYVRHELRAARVSPVTELQLQRVGASVCEDPFGSSCPGGSSAER